MAPCRRPRSSFNPRAREGRDALGRWPPPDCAVSTHAPARGATGISGVAAPADRVSTHAPARGATGMAQSVENRLRFQPTRPRGARLLIDERALLLATFQPTRPRGARLACVARHDFVGEVSTHAPARGATTAADQAGKFFSFQPTRPRGARRAGRRRRAGVQVVSTHAPARGATPAGAVGAEVARFQPTRPRGARHDRRLHQLHPRHGFNPRAREGRDAVFARVADDLFVSTHAPARGATAARCRSHPVPSGFNPRAREGRDQWLTNCSPRRCCFNPRAREGRDQVVAKRPSVTLGFNPRAREGRDGDGQETGLSGRVSTHAPARGATCASWRSAFWRLGFNPRAREGRDVRSSHGLPETEAFQPTRPRGARPARRPSGCRHLPVSTHAPARGATTASPQSQRASFGFNPRAREGRDDVGVSL